MQDAAIPPQTLVMSSRMKTAVLFVAISLLGVSCTTPASPEVRGRILDAATRRPIAGAAIQVAERQNTSVLNESDGSFRLPSHANFHVLCIPGPCAWNYIPAGRLYSDALIISHPGYQTIEFKAHCKAATRLNEDEPTRFITTDILLSHRTP